MKQAVLYVCHGSRLKQTQEEAVAFIHCCQKQVNAEIQQICFLELAKPSIKEGFAACVKQGATHIAVVPLLLLSAVHYKIDIPHEIAEVAKEYAFVQVTYGKPIGVHEKMADSVILRIKEVIITRPFSKIILIGRGSSDIGAINDLHSIAELVANKSGVNDVQACFLHGAKPSFEETLLKTINSKGRNILFVPYILFTGLLMKNIEKKVKLAQVENPNIHLGDYLGFDQNVVEVFIERVNEALLNEGERFSFRSLEDKFLYERA